MSKSPYLKARLFPDQYSYLNEFYVYMTYEAASGEVTCSTMDGLWIWDNEAIILENEFIIINAQVIMYYWGLMRYGIRYDMTTAHS